MPEPEIALVQMDAIPTETGAMVSTPRNMEEHCTYLDLDMLTFDVAAGFWRPHGTSGDRSDCLRKECYFSAVFIFAHMLII
jgi:hypothetical protein